MSYLGLAAYAWHVCAGIDWTFCFLFQNSNPSPWAGRTIWRNYPCFCVGFLCSCNSFIHVQDVHRFCPLKGVWLPAGKDPMCSLKWFRGFLVRLVWYNATRLLVSLPVLCLTDPALLFSGSFVLFPKDSHRPKSAQLWGNFADLPRAVQNEQKHRS